MSATLERMVTKPLSKSAQAAKDKQDAREYLRGLLKPGDTVYTILNHVSSSGMLREISLCIARDSEIRDITHWAARAMGSKRGKTGGIRIGGCGMDMGFSLVYSLSYALYPGGFACPIKLPGYRIVGIRPSDGKEVNVNVGRGKDAGPMTRAEIDRLYAKGWRFPGGRNGDQSGWDSDGGYSLDQRWL